MAEPKDKTKENEVTLEQFRRNLDHIRIDTSAAGPEVAIGDTVLRFKVKASVRALADLVGNENRVAGMESYLRKTLLPGQEAAFDALLEEIDVVGLSEILNALSEAYTSFPEKS